jgi:hypothetical protein
MLNEQSFRGPSIDASYQVSDHLAKQLQKRRIFKISQSETSHLWWPCLFTDNSCFWLADFFNSSPLKPLGQMIWILVGSIYGRSSIKIAHSVPIHLQTRPPQAILVSDWVYLANLCQSSRFFRNWPIRKKNCLWWPCLLTDSDKWAIFIRGLSIDASYQISDHLAMPSVTAWPNDPKLSRKHL